MGIDRREFICKGALAAAAAGGLAGVVGCARSSSGGVAGAPPTAPAGQAPQDPSAATARVSRAGSNRVFDAAPGDAHAAVASNKPAEELLSAAVEAFGGQDLIIKSGDRVVIKPNLAWGREPEFGANTSPEVLAAVIKMAKDAGAGEVLVVDHTCDNSAISFDLSGGRKVCDSLGVRLIGLDKQDLYRECEVGGTYIDKDALAKEILDCDVYINLPCLKHHGATQVSLGIKNQLGTNWDRQQHHRAGTDSDPDNLHQNIADLAKVLRPTVVIIDGMLALKTNGPKGPGDVEKTGTIIVSHDIVTADALGAQVLGHQPLDIPHIRMAQDEGIGSAALTDLRIARV